MRTLFRNNTEAKHDDSAVKHALKDVASAEKAEHHTAKVSKPPTYSPGLEL